MEQIFKSTQQEQALYVMVGLPGAGKSTYSKRLAECLPNGVVYSFDDIEEAMKSDGSAYYAGHSVMRETYRRIASSLKNGQQVIFDSTNVIRAQRETFLSLVDGLNVTDLRKICVVIDTPLGKCLEHNLERDRNVPESVIYHLAKKFEQPSYEEGWDRISTYKILEEGGN